MSSSWYEIRDVLLGHNGCRHRDFLAALRLAESCQHENAVFLRSCFADAPPSNDSEVLSVLESRARDVLCAKSLVAAASSDGESLHQAANMGCAFAQALWSSRCAGEERFKYASLSAAQDERDGFFRLAECFRFGIGCEHSLSRAKDLFHRAGELGHLAALEISGLLEECPVKKFTWLGRAARKGNVVSFLHQFAFGASHSSAALFVIGRALNGHVNVEAGTVFGQETSSNIFRLSLRAVAFYSAQLEAAKCTVNAWSLVGIRLKVVKDIRILIGKLVWDAREEASYEL